MKRVLSIVLAAALAGPLLVACGEAEAPITLPPTSAISLSGGSLTSTLGGTSGTAITLTRVNYTGTVTLTASGVPAGVTVSFSPAVLSETQTSSTLNITVAANAAMGSSSIVVTASGSGVSSAIALVNLTVGNAVPGTLGLLGLGQVNDRFTAELWVRGTTAYTTTWGTRGFNRGNAVKIWDVSANTPVLVDSLIVANATTLGDVQVSDDGSLLVVAIESNPNGGLAVYQLDSPRSARALVRTTGGDLAAGVHTAEVARVNGVLYAFCAMDPINGVPARLVIVSLANPSQPATVASLTIGAPFVHDVFVRDGLLFTAEWDDGMGIWDIGGGGTGGTISAPKRISRVNTVGGKAHNLWWYHDPSDNSKRYVIVGEEGPGVIGSGSSGDIHVMDISTITAPREVARYTVAGAGVHNFSIDEANGLLYAAFYNAGVRVLDIRGDLGTCTAAQKTADGRCDLSLMNREKSRFTGNGSVYVWGVHWSSSGFFASDMLNGLWRVVPATR